jgi:hypothetical protein
MKLKTLFLTLVLSASACIAKANNTPGNGEESRKNDIAGGVIHSETKKPISNVVVVAYTANKKEKAVLTDVNGNYSFNDLKPGTYKLVFEKDGFKKLVREKVQIRSDEDFQLNVELNEVESFLMMPGLIFTDLE